MTRRRYELTIKFAVYGDDAAEAAQNAKLVYEYFDSLSDLWGGDVADASELEMSCATTPLPPTEDDEL